MWCNQIFAFISMNDSEEGKVENLVVCDNIEWANQTARQLYGDTAVALDTTLFPLKTGDTYYNGDFYSPDGTKIHKNLSEAENIAVLQAENIALKEQQAEQDVILLENDYRLLLLQENITDII